MEWGFDLQEPVKSTGIYGKALYLLQAEGLSIKWEAN